MRRYAFEYAMNGGLNVPTPIVSSHVMPNRRSIFHSMGFQNVPHRRQRVCVLLWRLPKLEVPFVMLGKETCERVGRSVDSSRKGLPGSVGNYLEALDGFRSR